MMKNFKDRVLAVVVLAGVMACTDATATLPPGTVDPASVNDRIGAAGMYATTEEQFQSALAMFVVESGLLTDELQSNIRGAAQLTGSIGFDTKDAIDARTLPEEATSQTGATDALYAALHGVRTNAAQAIGALAKYDPDSSTGRRGMLYALEGYAEIMLADLFCSGVPLSTYDFEHDFTYRASSTTDQVYRHAIGLLDTAAVLGADSADVLNLARVGRGRAMLALGDYAGAAESVQDVPAAFVFNESVVTCTWTRQETKCYGTDIGGHKRPGFDLAYDASVADSEGSVGLPFRSSGDPRTASTFLGMTSTSQSFPVFFPNKYQQGQSSPIVVASGVEAQLIAAEANWYTATAGKNAVDPSPLLTVLDGLRSTNGLDPIDPATVSTFAAQRDTLFQERAAWLFVTGHRQGDLRRLVRQYSRPKGEVYPSGGYPHRGSYGNNIDAPIPYAERLNPKFNGCLKRD